VRKSLWKQKNIKEFHRRVQLGNIGARSLIRGVSEDEDDDKYTDKKEL
jgi:hypothetical protein